jgi:hypothetical protein
MPNFSLTEVKKLPFDFEDEVKKFVQAKKDHLLTEGVPAPTHHPWVEMSVRRIPGQVERSGGMTIIQPDDFVPDYTIIDDTPPPPSLAEKKAKIADEINRQAEALASQIAPPLKRKLFDVRIRDAHQAAGLAQAAHQEPSAADKATIAEHEARNAKIDAIYRHVAELESQIHDLTEDQVDVWKGAPFPDVSA